MHDRDRSYRLRVREFGQVVERQRGDDGQDRDHRHRQHHQTRVAGHEATIEPAGITKKVIRRRHSSSSSTSLPKTWHRRLDYTKMERQTFFSFFLVVLVVDILLLLTTFDEKVVSYYSGGNIILSTTGNGAKGAWLLLGLL